MLPIVARGIASLAGRMITRNPRLGKKIFDLFKKDRGITLYRGEYARMPGDVSKANMAKMFDITHEGFPRSGLRKQARGRWFSKDIKMAKDYAGARRFGWLKTGYKPGYIQKLTLSQKEAKLANKLANKLHGIEGGGLANYFVVSKKAMKRAKKDQLQTFINNFYKMIGKKKGGLAQILNV